MILEAPIDRSRPARWSSMISAALPAYEIGNELGRGACGVVLAARHRQLRRSVAVKQLPRAFGADPGARSRFRAEARLLAALDHPHIVDIYDFVDYDGMCLLVMERLTGGTAWTRFETAGFTPDMSCAVLLAVSAGLHHAHQRGVLHRDVKPENVMFTGDGTPKITDLGIAKVVGSDETFASRVGEVLGTPAYIAPEQARGDELTPATDVYQAGTMLYELLAGRLPFPVECDPATLLYRHVHESPPSLLEVAPHIPAPIAEVVDRSIATSAAERYESAEAFGVAIATAAACAWGGGWLARTNVPISASGPILDAAVTAAPRPNSSIRCTTHALEVVQSDRDDRHDRTFVAADGAGTDAPPLRSVEPVNETLVAASDAVRPRARRPAGRGQRRILLSAAAVVVIVVVASVAAALSRATSGSRRTPSSMAQTAPAPRKSEVTTRSPSISFPPTPPALRQAAYRVPAAPACSQQGAGGADGCHRRSSFVAGNTATTSIDHTSPTISWEGGPTDGGSYSYGFVPAPPTCTAVSASSGSKNRDECSVSGYGTGVGSHTLTATAHDNAGHEATETRSYTVVAWTLTGFYEPVQMSSVDRVVWNTVNNGQTVALKFNVRAGSTELTDVSRVVGFTPTSVVCPASTPVTNSISSTTTDPTSLHYDTTAHQFVQSWQTPKTAGGCYKVTLTTQDGSVLFANFKLT